MVFRKGTVAIERVGPITIFAKILTIKYFLRKQKFAEVGDHFEFLLQMEK
jgi:hypothetical protein